ncbi:MAG: crossover junction endodeoxyribonuclease RuvC [Candidatus Niyogibacteria bacterium]|nr:crossover junction endodeoxyribonuclease RuvC [Candidatus Niyogibacteria bacterium]
MSSEPLRILGVDPGYGRLGYAVLERKNAKESLITAGCIETPSALAHEKRLRLIGSSIEKLVREHRPSGLGIEKLFLSTNHKTAMQVAEARGVALYSAGDLPVYEFSPPEIKLAVCGYGRADKRQIAAMIRMIFNPSEPLLDDATDAIAIAFTALGRIR